MPGRLQRLTRWLLRLRGTARGIESCGDVVTPGQSGLLYRQLSQPLVPQCQIAL